MEITFKDKKVRDLCEKKAIAERKPGQACSRKLRSRLADLQAVESVSGLVAGRPHPLKGERTGEFGIDLEGGKRLVFKPVGQPIPRIEDGRIAWSQVTEICIVFIGDYHD